MCVYFTHTLTLSIFSEKWLSFRKFLTFVLLLVPVSAFRLSAFKLSNNTTTSPCLDYRRYDGTVCAQQCIPENMGMCPRWVPVKIGMLERGNCAELKYTEFVRVLTIFAGPCGVMYFDVYSKAPDRRQASPSPYKNHFWANNHEILVPKTILGNKVNGNWLSLSPSPYQPTK